MRIVAIEPFVVAIPLTRPVTGVHGDTVRQRSVLVRVASDDGIEGWGNVDPSPGYSTVTADDVWHTVTALAPALIGADPGNIHRVLQRMDEEVAHGAEAKAAIEMALWDLKGKALGLPVHVLLGGRVKDEVTLNAWIGTAPPEQAAREARDWLDRGFRSAKIKIAGPSAAGIARVAAVRAAVGDRMTLRVDFNESLTAADAVAYINRLDACGLQLCEQPVPRADIAGLAEVRRAVRTPIMADESVTDPASVLEIIRREAAQIVKVKVMKQGGLLRTRQLIDIAAAAGIRSVIGHGFGLSVSTLAEAHVALVSAAVLEGCEAVGPLKMAADVVTDPPRVENGVLKVPDTPGLGATIDRDALERWRVEVA